MKRQEPFLAHDDRSFTDGIGELGDKHIRMTGGKLYVRRTVRPDADGIIIPDNLKDRGKWCEVLACGPAVPQEINKGDFVALPEFTSSSKMWRSPFDPECEMMVDKSEIHFVLAKEEYLCLMNQKSSTPSPS